MVGCQRQSRSCIRVNQSISQTIQKQGDIHLRLARRNDGVTGDELSEDSTSGLNTKGKGADINKDDILSTLFAGKNTTLNSSTIGNCLIGVYTLGRLSAVKVLLQELLNLGNTSGTTDKDNLQSLD